MDNCYRHLEVTSGVDPDAYSHIEMAEDSPSAPVQPVNVGFAVYEEEKNINDLR